MSDFALGTETDGSITCPAAVNGVVGFKPSIGLVSRTRIVPISESQDTAGPITRSVAQAAAMMDAIAGSDPADPATAEADRRRTGYVAALAGASLKGKRLGVMRFASGFGTDPAFDAALALLKREGAVLVEIPTLDRSAVGRNEFPVLLTEFKAGIDAYLKTTPPTVTARSLDQLIAANKADPRILGLFGQDIFEQAAKTKGLADPAYRKARADALAAAGTNGIDRLVRELKLDALVGPTMPPAWPIDPVNGDQIAGGGAGNLAAVAGTPHLTVPMGFVRGLPVGLSFIGPRWSDAAILALGAAYEAARGPLPPARPLPSVEARPEIAPLLAPLRPALSPAPSARRWRR